MTKTLDHNITIIFVMVSPKGFASWVQRLKMNGFLYNLQDDIWYMIHFIEFKMVNEWTIYMTLKKENCITYIKITSFVRAKALHFDFISIAP